MIVKFGNGSGTDRNTAQPATPKKAKASKPESDKKTMGKGDQENEGAQGSPTKKRKKSGIEETRQIEKENNSECA